ncbi:uncharacterized protein LOC131995745 [Stomoxys calcitrans]|uniref:uncharacterized protein LOC131995745 n=1 Tax=Stomoxys calcitrans TaxID=35570 RepID=UPI0027E2F0BB|nr:uncharacterized protein LOC131995745 [Stomoxys calcitrans]
MSELATFIKEQRDLLDLLIKYESRFDAKNPAEKTHGYVDALGQRVDDIFNRFEAQHDTIIQKFYYLRSTLGGEAANLIRNISATEANYDSAWKILESRYHNRRMLVGNLISRLFNIPKSDGGFQSIKTLLDSAQECLSSLQNLNIDASTWDPLLIHLLVQKLDLQSRRDWEQSLKSSTEIPLISELFSFLERTFRTLESMTDEFPSDKQYPTKGRNKSNNNSKSNAQVRKASCNSGQFSKPKPILCAFCEKPHSLAKCFKFLALPLSDKVNFLSKKNACQNCFVVGHDHNNCKSPFRCITCKQLHHTVLHSDGPLTRAGPTGCSGNAPTQMASHSAQAFHSVLLYTIRLRVVTNRGKFTLRALLDPGSQGSLISESTVQLIGLEKNTHFGWVFSGPSNSVSSHQIHIHNVHLDHILRSFWEQEEVLPKRKFTEEEEACEEFFEATTTRTVSGRYVVKLPFRSILKDGSSPTLQNNVLNALRRLKQLEISFSRKPLFCESYTKFLKEYENLGHMSKIGVYPSDVRQDSYFLPHHGVLKESSTTTKLRVVFDGSSHSRESKSLNDELSPGPALQNDLPGILTRWRRHRIAFSADIEKMFRQIDVCPGHRKFQQILWRFSPFDEISIYELNTVTYGTASAPYLAIRVLQRLAHDYRDRYPVAARVLLQDSYVDDVISGSDSIDNVKPLYKDLCTLLDEGGCNLRKWVTNSKELLAVIPEEHRGTSVNLNFDRDNVVRTLGIQWNTATDSFFFEVNLDKDPIASKRRILSESARLYDPLGWLTPITVVAKSLFKQLWEHGVDWDDNVPREIEDLWFRHRASLPKLANLAIPRWIQWNQNSESELHCFCDASSVAYAAVVYVRIVTANDTFVHLLQAKSKVSPIKTVSIPRLELCAAALGVKLARKVQESLADLGVRNVFYWSDSSTVLSWIHKSPSNWTVYVANRVADIQRCSNPIQWRYVPSALNPADCASRGIQAEELIGNRTWWFGPHFLYGPQSSWPESLPNLCTSKEERAVKITTNVATEKAYPELLSKFSKLHTLLRITSLCFRFCHNCKHPDERITGPLSIGDVNKTLMIFVRITQEIDFPEELSRLSARKVIAQSPILKLMPFLDETGIIRVGGRLQNSNFPYDVKHPLVLAKSNPLSVLIISDAHERTLHGGVTLTMSYVNRRYWIISGNQLAKRVINRCLKCFRFAAKTSQQIMGNLPQARLMITRPFKHSGVDYAGPITIKTSNLRSTVTSKGYICLFVCMVTKAIHLEAVTSLTTNAFLSAFRRFVSRRGACTDLYSDCGTNFVGASKELQVLFEKSQKSLPEEVLQALSQNCTTWHFIPPASPNFGDLWEAGVKSVKYHLKRIIGERNLTFEELTTLLCQIEGCLNSRPLCPLSSDPSNFEALTPAHFLVGEPTICIPEESLLETNINLLSRWKCVEKMKQHFWKRWRNEYVNRLQARPKWLKSRSEPTIGDLVLVVDERCGPGQWLLGRIEETHPGPDGQNATSLVDTNIKSTA